MMKLATVLSMFVVATVAAACSDERAASAPASAGAENAAADVVAAAAPAAAPAKVVAAHGKPAVTARPAAAPAKTDPKTGYPVGMSKADIAAFEADARSDATEPEEVGSGGFDLSKHKGWTMSGKTQKAVRDVFLYASSDEAAVFGHKASVCKKGTSVKIVAGDGFQGFANCGKNSGYVNITGADGPGMID